MKYRILLVLFLLISFSACKPLKMEDIDRKFSEGKYFEAAEDYRKLYGRTSPKKRELRGTLAFKMGEAYRLANNPFRASFGYANATRYQVSDSTLHLQYARTLHKLGKYKDAQKEYEEFLKLYPKNEFALKGVQGTALAQEWKQNPSSYKIKKETLFDQSKGSSFSPALLPPTYDQVFFSSNGGKELVNDTISPITGMRNNDIFFSRKDENGKWMKVEHVDSKVNSAGDDGVVSFSADGNLMFYTYAPMDSVKMSPAGIFMSRRSGGVWSEGEKLIINPRDTMSVYAHPAISPSGNYLYFVSDMKGGHGGKDIWRAKLFGGEVVDYFENLGPEINTAGDEMFPYVRNDSTLYFSSDGHAGMGGLDIYKASYRKATQSWSIENMKYPINSSADDFSLTLGEDDKVGFFSSNRDDSRGWDHIYSFVNEEVYAKVDGYIVDTDDEFITNATVRLVGKDGTNRKFPGKNDGTYTQDVEQDVDYVLLASAPNHLNAKMYLKTIPLKKDSIYFVDFILTPINKPVVLENIFFDFDKYELLPESKEGLDELIELLDINPNVTIELSSHTDRKGTDTYNDKLSQRRADAVMNYLIKIGRIAPDRLTSVGKGKREPKTVTKAILRKYKLFEIGDLLSPEYIDSLEVEKQPVADQINRRTEFKVSSITYGLE